MDRPIDNQDYEKIIYDLEQKNGELQLELLMTAAVRNTAQKKLRRAEERLHELEEKVREQNIEILKLTSYIEKLG